MENEAQAKKNLFYLTIGSFMVSLSLGEVTPFLSLFIATLGHFSKSELGLYSALAYSATFLAMAISSPFWGRLADQHGRRVMLIRAAIGLAIIFVLMGFVTNVWVLIVLRLFHGVFGGYLSNANALIAANTPKRDVGKALGIMVTGSTSGMFLGPLVGGIFASIVDLRETFFITAAGLFLVFLITVFKIKEDFHPVNKEHVQNSRNFFAHLRNRRLIFGLFLTTLIVQMINLSINPIISLYVKEIMHNSGAIALMAGIVSSAPGISTAVMAPIFGRLGDRIGSQKMLMFGFIMAFWIQLGTSFVSTIGLLIVMRFLIGISDATMLPAVNSLLSKNTDHADISRVFAYNQSFMSIGAMAGPILGSVVAGIFDYKGIFVACALLILLNIFIFMFSERKVDQ